MENNHEGDDDEVSLDLSLGCRDAAAANAAAADGFQMPSPSIYGYNAWTRRPFDQPPAIGRLAPESYHLGTRLPPSSSSSLPNSAMGRFDMPYRSPTVVDGIGDGYRMDIAGAGAGASSSKSQQEIDLDLSLKL
nr:zinc finger protein 1-like [Ipomoea batatas]